MARAARQGERRSRQADDGQGKAPDGRVGDGCLAREVFWNLWGHIPLLISQEEHGPAHAEDK